MPAKMVLIKSAVPGTPRCCASNQNTINLLKLQPLDSVCRAGCPLGIEAEEIRHPRPLERPREPLLQHVRLCKAALLVHRRHRDATWDPLRDSEISIRQETRR